MGDHVLSRTKSYRYLGLLVDEKLSWTNHIDEVCKKLSQIAGVIFKARTLLTKEALMLVYHALVGSKLRYGLVCWATASQYLLDKVNVAHNKIITYMTFSKRCSRMWPLYSPTNRGGPTGSHFSHVLTLEISQNPILAPICPF